MIGSTEIIVIALIVLILFGATAIPKFARSLGRAKAELEKGFSEGQKEGEAEDNKEAGKKS